MYLAKQLTTRSYPDIGRRFGGRDHTTVLHAVKRIEELKASEPGLVTDLESITRKLKE
jgi:chromosomal replication initiator protein